VTDLKENKNDKEKNNRKVQRISSNSAGRFAFAYGIIWNRLKRPGRQKQINKQDRTKNRDR
jgi:hypothetical protein